MPFNLDSLHAADLRAWGIDGKELQRRIDAQTDVHAKRFRRLWAYYKNPMTEQSADFNATSSRPYRQAQEWGLPVRITGGHLSSDALSSYQPDSEIARKEIVIENDIGWRIDTMIDYLFGQSIVIDSTAPDPARRATISRLLRLILAHNGGLQFLQQLALMGSVYGYVDILVKLNPQTECDASSVTTTATATDSAASTTQPDRACLAQNLGEPSTQAINQTFRIGAVGATDAPSPDAAPVPADPMDPNGAHPVDASHDSSGAGSSPLDSALQRIARRIRLEVVEPARALPLLSPVDWTHLGAYATLHTLKRAPSSPVGTPAKHGGWWGKFLRGNDGRFLASVLRADDDEMLQIVELITCHRWQRYENQRLVASGENSLGKLPLVHIQNAAVPFEYAGASDVEPLLPLQDELNTRLSDRAHRIAMQSFKMYLGKGIDNFSTMPVAPVRMWSTDNQSAEVIEFGGDSVCPSEESHIHDIREAIDKTSGVTPIAAGALKGRIGRLTSAAALRITLQALLAKTEKKRATYGAGISQLCAMSLEWLDRAGLFPTAPDERSTEIHWPHPIPANETEKLQDAEIKLRLGIPRDVVLRELGY